MTELSDTFRAALRGQASTVCVVTAATPEGPRGMTATAVMSLTADPPSLAVAVNRSASLNPRLAQGAIVSVQFLEERQSNLARSFAGGLPAERRFEVGAWRDDEWGSPVLDGAMATLSGVVELRVETSTHSLIVIATRGVRTDATARPLLYANGQFTALAAPGCRCAA
jgi:flavin reductase (DIM6/NTAB) family NADH-FMN oxidoreductase RutF